MVYDYNVRMGTESIKKFELLRTKNLKIERKAVGGRIRSLRGGDSLTAFGRKIGVAHTTVRRYENGMLPSPDILLKISSLSGGRTVEWFLTGREGLATLPPQVPANLPEDEFRSVPLIEGKIAAGEPIIAEEDIIEWVVVHIRPIKKNLSREQDLVACRVSGDSMSPQLASGDIVVIDRGCDSQTILKGRMYAVWVDGGLTVKLLQREKKSLFLIPINNAESVMVVDLRLNPAPVVGLVIGGWRNFAQPL